MNVWVGGGGKLSNWLWKGVTATPGADFARNVPWKDLGLGFNVWALGFGARCFGMLGCLCARKEPQNNLCTGALVKAFENRVSPSPR